MDVKYIIVILAIIAIFLYTFLITKVKSRGGGSKSGPGIPLSGKLRGSPGKKMRPVILEPESTATWEKDLEEIDRYWGATEEMKEEKVRKRVVKKENKKKTKERETEIKTEEKEEAEEEAEAAVDNERRRVKLLWKNYLQKVDKFIEKLEKGTSKRYFEYYKEYENLDKFYSRFVFNFGLYLSEQDKKKASGRMGYCSTLLREMLDEV
ncbi:MAG: hypothetical protein U9N35_03965 [Euryarchaeota archaeon]|nr:hypothetical protein [Euryarchaeota archaeon]